MKEDAEGGMFDGKMHQAEAAYVARHTCPGRTRAGVPLMMQSTEMTNLPKRDVRCASPQ